MLRRLLRENERRLDGETSGAADQVVAVQEVKSVVEALLAHVGEDFGLGWEEDANKAVNVLLRKLDACVGQIQLEWDLKFSRRIRLSTLNSHGTAARCRREDKCLTRRRTG